MYDAQPYDEQSSDDQSFLIVLSSSVDGPSPSGKAVGFDPTMRRFESCRPSHSFMREAVCLMIE